MGIYRIGPIKLELRTRTRGLTDRRSNRIVPVEPPSDCPVAGTSNSDAGRRVCGQVGWFRRIDYWLSIWKTGPEHITIKPYKGTWMVEYDPKNSWMGGETLSRGFSFDVAIDAAEQIDAGATQRDLWMDYRDCGCANYTVRVISRFE